MLSKKKIKLVRSLEMKKNRYAEGLFVAEGKKIVTDLIASKLTLKELFCTGEILPRLSGINHDLISVVAKDDLDRISSLKSLPDIIALFEIPAVNLNMDELKKEVTLVLDSIQDPGNLGTIIRTADWFGIKNIICSEDSVDVYNLKTIQATMGAIGRVNIHYHDLGGFLSRAKKENLIIYGTFTEGEDLYSATLTSEGLIVLGNEGKGISSEIESLLSKRICIPRYPVSDTGPESLNVASAAAIICSEFRKKIR